MSLFGAFAAPTLGMLTQSQAFGTISQNITNMNTGGYKAGNTRFSTVLASTFYQNSDVGGVAPRNVNYVSQQGRIISTSNSLDIAINGKGLFVLNTELSGDGEELYTRDGGFQVRVVDGEGYLTDKNGYFVQAWEPDAQGAFSTSSTLGPVRLDEDAFDDEAEATETASLAANLPAESEAGDVYTTTASAYDSNGDLRTFDLVWTRQATAQTWTVHVRSDTEAPDDPTNTNILGAGTSPAYGSEATFTFDETGHLPTDTNQTLTIDYGTDPDLSITLNLDDVTAIGQSFLYLDFQKDGRGPGDLQAFRFDDQGQILGKFSNGIERALYKLPVATFINADGLEIRQGNLFAVSELSGDPVLRQVRDPAVVVDGANGQKNEFATFVPYAHELSNVNLEDEFSRMIMTQQAYNSSATVFKTVDEMTKTASELKS